MFTSEVLFENEFNFTHFTTGQKHSAAIDDQGRIYLWGSNGRNQLGVENSSQTFNITGDESTTYVSVALGDYHTIALRDDQRVVSWGQNMWGELGTGEVTRGESYSIAEPTEVEGLDEIVINWVR